MILESCSLTKMEKLRGQSAATVWTRKIGREPVEPKPKPKPLPTAKANKSASLVFYYFGDGPFTTLFQNAGVNLQHTLKGYDKTCLLKKAFSKINKNPDYYGQPTEANFFNYLRKLAKEGYYIDVYIFTHGSKDGIQTYRPNSDKKGKITADDLREKLKIFGEGKFPIRMVYQMNCWGSNLNQAFIDVGAKVVTGSRYVNFMSTRFNAFGKAWQKGKSFYQCYVAQNSAGDATIPLMKVHFNANKRKYDKDDKPEQKVGPLCKGSVKLHHNAPCIKTYFKSHWSFEDSYFVKGQTGVQILKHSSLKLFKGNTSININSKLKW